MPTRRDALAPVVFLIAAAGLLPSAAADNPFADQPKADDVFYHLMPIAWRDGSVDSDGDDPNRFGDLVGVREGLPYLDELGITAYWMNPIFPSPAYHGYQHGRADQINPWFGTEQDFRDLLDASHQRGIEVYLDFVVYGISRDSTWYQDAFANPASPYDDWLAFTNPANTQSQGYSFSTWNGDNVGFTHWDLRNEDARDLVTEWALTWLDPDNDGDPSDGVDGYRLDHVWVNYGSGPDGWGYNLDDFWAHWHAALRDLNPGVFTFAEQHNWGSHGGELLPQFDAAMTKPFEFAARDALWLADAGPLYAQMQQTIDSLPAELGTYVAIIGDHDVDRLASSIGADTHATIGRAKAAAAVLLLQPFPPIIYYGDEIAMIGTKQNYGSDANDIPMREPFRWNALEGPPMSRYHRENVLAYAYQFSFNLDGRSVQEQTGDPDSVLETYRTLIGLRHNSVALRRGSYHPIAAADAPVWAFLRRYEHGEAPIPDDTQTLIAAVNLSNTAITTSLDLSPFIAGGSPPLTAYDASPTGGPLPSVTPANAGDYQLTIPAHGYALVLADLNRPPEPRFRVDGRLEPGYRKVATGPGGSIHALLDGDQLFIATDPASNTHDRFLLLAELPGPLTDAMWAKAGSVAQHDAFIGNEADNNWAGWFNANIAQSPAAAEVLEGALDLRAQFGSVPETIYLAAASFGTDDGQPLDPDSQVPLGNGDTDIQNIEFARINTADLTPIDCPGDTDADNTVAAADLLTVLNNFGRTVSGGPLDGDVAPFTAADRSVNAADLLLVLSHFGSDCN